MKKLNVLLLVLAILLVVPFGVFAEESKDAVATEESREVTLYFFHGNGCGFCANAAAWFEEIEEEYGDKFEVVEYEVWNNKQNSKLMEAVSEVRKETPGGVPYIIVGDQSWDGFSDNYKDSIISKIESEYEQEPSERYDIMDYVDLSSLAPEDNTTRDILVLLVLVGVVAAVSVGIVFARKQTN